MSESTYKLIKSLSNREKAYFRKQSNIHNEKQDKNYLKLYDTLENMSTYDKDKLLDIFANTKIEKYLSSELNYLKNRILKSLFNFHLANSSKIEIKEGIILIEMLLKKGLKKDALKKLNFIKKVAYKKEEFISVLQLLDLEEKIQFNEGSFDFHSFLEKNKVERNKITACLENLNELRMLREEIRQLQFRDRFLVKGLENLLSQDKIFILENKSFCLSQKALDHWYYSRTMRYYLERNFTQALESAEAHLNFLFENKSLIPVNDWLSKTSNFLYMAALLGDQENYDKGIDLIKSLRDNHHLDTNYINYIICSRTLCFAYHSSDLELSAKWLKISEEFIRKHHDLSEVQHSNILMEMIRCCISLNDYLLGAQMINALIQVGIYESDSLLSRLYSMMIHYKLAWFQLLESEVIALQKLKKKFPRETDLISYFHTFFKHVTQQGFAQKSQIKSLQSQLKKLSNNPEKNFAFQEFDFYAWSQRL